MAAGFARAVHRLLSSSGKMKNAPDLADGWRRIMLSITSSAAYQIGKRARLGAVSPCRWGGRKSRTLIEARGKIQGPRWLALISKVSLCSPRDSKPAAGEQSRRIQWNSANRCFRQSPAIGARRVGPIAQAAQAVIDAADAGRCRGIFTRACNERLIRRLGFGMPNDVGILASAVH